MPGGTFHRLAARSIYFKTCPLVARISLAAGAQFAAKSLARHLPDMVLCESAQWLLAYFWKRSLLWDTFTRHLTKGQINISSTQRSLCLITKCPGPLRLYLHKMNVLRGKSEWKEAMVWVNFPLIVLPCKFYRNVRACEHMAQTPRKSLGKGHARELCSSDFMVNP